MKRFYIVVDLEGVAGVARWDQLGIEGNTPEFLAAVKLCTQELAACVEGILQAAPDAEIWAWDGHYHGSLDIARFPKGARLLNNAPIEPPYCMDLEKFDGLFFLGSTPCRIPLMRTFPTPIRVTSSTTNSTALS